MKDTIPSAEEVDALALKLAAFAGSEMRGPDEETNATLLRNFGLYRSMALVAILHERAKRCAEAGRAPVSKARMPLAVARRLISACGVAHAPEEAARDAVFVDAAMGILVSSERTLAENEWAYKVLRAEACQNPEPVLPSLTFWLGVEGDEAEQPDVGSIEGVSLGSQFTFSDVPAGRFWDASRVGNFW